MSKQNLFLVFLMVAVAAFYRSHQTVKESQSQLLHAKQVGAGAGEVGKDTREIAPPEFAAEEPRGRIVFTSYRLGNASSLFSMEADGTDARNLRIGSSAAASPDGTRLLAVQFYNDTGRFEIVLTDVDGKSLGRLTHSEAEDSTSPAWSPDGEQIAFQSGDFSKPSIYVMSADGSGRRRLTPYESNDRAPAWSPDGRQIAFSSSRDGGEGVFVMNADGSLIERLTDKSWSSSDPAWSPDGRYLATVVYVRKGRKYFLRIIETQTGEWWDALKDRERITSPCWSPDGNWLAFSMSAGKNADIYIVRPDGEGLRNLTNEKAADLKPSWIPAVKEPELANAR